MRGLRLERRLHEQQEAGAVLGLHEPQHAAALLHAAVHESVERLRRDLLAQHLLHGRAQRRLARRIGFARLRPVPRIAAAHRELGHVEIHPERECSALVL